MVSTKSLLMMLAITVLNQSLSLAAPSDKGKSKVGGSQSAFTNVDPKSTAVEGEGEFFNYVKQMKSRGDAVVDAKQAQEAANWEATQRAYKELKKSNVSDFIIYLLASEHIRLTPTFPLLTSEWTIQDMVRLDIACHGWSLLS